jgi:hypothetical protein
MALDQRIIKILKEFYKINDYHSEWLEYYLNFQ